MSKITRAYWLVSSLLLALILDAGLPVFAQKTGPGANHLYEALDRAYQAFAQGNLNEASRFVVQNKASGQRLARPNFLRPDQDTLSGVGDDIGLAREIYEAFDRAYKAISAGNFNEAVQAAQEVLKLDPKAETAVRILVHALSRTGQRDKALAEANSFIAQNQASGQLLAQRGYLRLDRNDFSGAAADFEQALQRGGLDVNQTANVRLAMTSALSRPTEERFAQAEALSRSAEAKGNIEAAAQFLRAYLSAVPRDANAWFALGFLYSRHQRLAEAGEAFERGLQIEKRGDALYSAGIVLSRSAAGRASQYFREAVDKWYSDPRLSNRTAREFEVLRNHVVDADASIITNLTFGGIWGRPLSDGGRYSELGAETAVRFDGRYLPAVAGLQMYARGLGSRDQTDFKENQVALGLRWQPFRETNFYVAPEYRHSFDPAIMDQFVLNWGLGIGGILYSLSDAELTRTGADKATIAIYGLNYPYEEEWRPLWSFDTFGSYREREQRYLQSFSGVLSYAYWARTPIRTVLGPALMSSVNYDSVDAKSWAAGAGPGIVFRTWLGGDKYRAYDTLLTLNAGYLFSIGDSKRLNGFQTRVAVTF